MAGFGSDWLSWVQVRFRDRFGSDSASEPGAWLGEGCTCTYDIVRRLTVFFPVFPAVIQLTVVASLHRADVFRVRLGGHCREFGVKSSVLDEVNAPFEHTSQ